MEPILKYPGAKWRQVQWLLSHMPPHESYVEPYAGSLALFFNKPRARLETVNDLDGNIVNFYRVCREHPEELAEALSLTPYARVEFDTAARPQEACDSVERARLFAVKCWMAFGASATSTGWRQSTGNKVNGGPDNPKMWRRLPELVIQAAECLKYAQIECRPALEVIKRFDGPNTLVYADPPYVTSTRTAHREQYRYEMTDADHMELLRALQAHSGMVMLSGYDCEMYRDMLADWNMVSVKSRAELGAIRTECLWLNPAACDAADYFQLKFDA